MGPSLPESSPQPPLRELENLKRTEWDLGTTEAVPTRGRLGAQACSLRSRATFNKQGLSMETSFSNPTRWEKVTRP